ncbi:putative gustatory receptor 47b [Calliphora vicina]|uniref:putative gustatory receptor 47b n=1 Tax=Calliphora vicina TaxID=7373 RepID=UPI00325B2B16
MSSEKLLPVKSIHQCFHLIYILLYHTGCLGCQIRNGKELYYDKWYKLYAYLYRLVYLTGLIGGFLYKIYDEELNEAMMGILTPVVKTILTFECFICPISYVEVTFHLDWYRDKYVNLANTLQTLDEQLQRNFPGIEWNYHKSTRKYNPMTVGLYGFYTIVSCIYIFNIAHCTCGWISSTILSICYSCVTGAPAFAGFLFIGNMDMLRLRFRLIRKLLRQHLMNSQKKSRHLLVEDVAKFKQLESYFTQYSSLIVTLNQVFSVVSGSGLFHDFAITTSLGYLLCSKALDTKAKLREYIFVSLFMTPRIYKVITTSMYGYATQKERRNCCHEFIQIEYNFEKSELLRQPMEAFLHWRMHNNYRITVGKILNCNLSLIFLTLNSVVNYIMILIQLQFQQNNIVNRFLNNIDSISKDAEVL